MKRPIQILYSTPSRHKAAGNVEVSKSGAHARNLQSSEGAERGDEQLHN